MKTITILKSCILVLRGAFHKLEVGVHEVEAEIADHWFVKAHSDVQAAVEAEALKAKTLADDLALVEKARAEAQALKAKAEEEAKLLESQAATESLKAKAEALEAQAAAALSACRIAPIDAAKKK